MEVIILKAIHNRHDLAEYLGMAVISNGSYHFESNSQPGTTGATGTMSCDFQWKLSF